MDQKERNARFSCGVLELDKVLAMLAEETSCPDGAQAVMELTPETDLQKVEELLKETGDAHMLVGRFGSPSFSGVQNCTNSLRRASAGGLLTMGELLRVAQLLRAQRSLQEWRRHSAEMDTSLDWRFDALYSNKYLEEKISLAILSEEEMADDASQTLLEIRRKIRNTGARIREQLDKMIRSQTYQKYLQEAIVTIRDGRFVVPVKAEFRGEVNGLVHDTSASGATVFIEPMAVVEANNDIRVLMSKEKAEIERILAEFSAEAGTFADEIITGYGFAVQLNVIFAKARLAYRMKASMPLVNDEGCVCLHKARHPLIDPQKVVPTNIELGANFDTLVITGPNTGGKTVVIKTIGLLTLMAMCGMMIPAMDGSKVSVFETVLADIGDEQSIEQSLSTFSSHMVNIIRILEQTNDRSLILLDELGAGTDPVEGAALAEAILEHMRMLGAHIAATTHYAELKMYALETAGVENACCEFDVATLRPTYRLLIGVPGRSNAFAISQRLGMPEDIIERGQGLVSGEGVRFEEVVRKLETSRQELEKEKQLVEEYRLQAQRAAQEAEELQNLMEKDKEKEMEKARVQARTIVTRARAQAEALVDELERMKKEKESADVAGAKATLRAGIRAMEETADPIVKKKEEVYRLPRPLKIGDAVRIFDINKQGTVLALPDNNDQVLVQAGIIRTKVPLSNLHLEKSSTSAPKPATSRRGGGSGTFQSRVTAAANTEIDLRGMMTDEAIPVLDRFIDGAVMSKLNVISIIHGKGTGALRAAVQQHLKRHPSVKSYRLGVYGEGEAGVTIAELK